MQKSLPLNDAVSLNAHSVVQSDQTPASMPVQKSVKVMTGG